MESNELEQAVAMLREAEKELVNQCSTAVGLVLKQYNCKLEVDVVIRGNEIRSRVIVLPNPGSVPSDNTPIKKATAETPENNK